MKDNLPYFSHDNNSRRHPKMKALIAEFGYEGYGKFWALSERVAESSGAYIDISKKVYKLDLAQELGFSGDELDKFLTFLSDPEINLINIQSNIVTIDRITELFEKTMENREDERDRKKAKKGKDDFPGGKEEIPPGKEDFPDEFPPEKHTDKTRQNKTKQDKNKHSEEMKISLSLAEMILSEHRKEFPDYLAGKDKQTIQKWAFDIEKLIRIDKKTPENIREVILWVKTPNNFWFHNIESGAKLRKQFERLFGQMKTERQGYRPSEERKFGKSSEGSVDVDALYKQFGLTGSEPEKRQKLMELREQGVVSF
jgi:hypothetical protein